MENKLFKIGDVVKLKFGETKMTITNILTPAEKKNHGNNDYQTYWFEGTKIQQKFFRETDLEKVS
jgi:uncharacterized protein YodC (DUF2158 family)